MFQPILHIKNSIDRTVAIGLIAVVALLPLHTVLTTWAGSNFGNLLLFRSWMEIVLAVLSLLVAYRLYIQKKIATRFFEGRLIRLIFGYGLLHIVLIVVLRPDLDAAAAGFAINTRFLAVLFIVKYLSLVLKKAEFRELRSCVLRVFGCGAVFIVLFGLMQVFVLPDDFLEFFGYSKETTPAFMTVDDTASLVRAQSTLRGPNPLGSFLILPILAAFSHAYKKKSLRFAGLGVLGVVLMYFTYSRSAWLGLFAGLVFMVFMVARGINVKVFNYFILGSVVFGALVIGLLAVTDSSYINRIILHDESGEVLSESNLEHFESIRDSSIEVIKDPLGDGPGTSGPASFHNDDVTRISENYFIQIAQEVGVVGLALFAAIIYVLLTTLKTFRSDGLYLPVVAGLIGVSVSNMFVHAWTDPATVVSWWLLASLILFGRKQTG